jgi:hypothetical protein
MLKSLIGGITLWIGLSVANAHAQDVASVLCESIKGREAYCPTPNARDVFITSQLSSSACIEGSTWGFDGRGIWVVNGCRAYFDVEIAREYRHPRNEYREREYNDRQRDYGRDRYGYQPPARQFVPDVAVIACESIDGRYTTCPVPVRRNVQLVNQLSRARCTFNYSWGFDRRGIWVARGCRAEFSIN